MKHMDLRVLLIAIAAGDDVRRHSQYCTLLLPACLRNTATTASMAPTCTQKYILKKKLFRSFTAAAHFNALILYAPVTTTCAIAI